MALRDMMGLREKRSCRLTLQSACRPALGVAFALASVCGLVTPVRAQTPATAAEALVSNSAPEAVEMDAVLSRYFAPNRPGATVIVTRNGKTVFRKAYGMADIEQGVALQPEMMLRAGSLTKQFTAAAILLLAEQGKLSTTDNINKFLPDYPTHGAVITIENLLTHTSGIKNYTALPKHAETQRIDMTVSQVIDLFKNEPLEFEPGARFAYSNSGYFLLGAIIEKVSGLPYADFMGKHLFEPLHMQHTSCDPNERLILPPVHGYTKSRIGFDNAPSLSLTHPYAAGALRSNVDDLALWNDAMAAGKLLKPESWKRMSTPFTLKGGASTDYGYGWFVRKMRRREATEHSGLINGFSAETLHLPGEGIYIAMLGNDDSQDPALVALVQKLAVVLLP